MDIIAIIISGISVALSIVILGKLKVISRQLENPIVKKLKPELKLKPVKKNFKDGNSNSRNSKGPRAAKKDDDRSDKRPNRNRSNTKNNPRNNRSRNRLQHSDEIVSNEETQEKATETKSEAPKAAQPTKPERPKLAPRGERSAPKTEELPPKVESTVSAPKAEAQVAAPIAEAPAKENKPIRHGRRNQVKKAPSFED